MNTNDLKYGIFLFIAFTAYFLFMQAIDLYQNFNLRMVNVVFHFALVYLAIQEFQKKGSMPFDYLSGTLAGIKPSFIGVLLFAVFQLFYLIIDDAFVQHLQENAPIGNYINPVSAAIIVFFEGMAVSIFISYIAMRIVENRQIDQYEKRL